MERQANIEMDTAKEAEKFRDTSYEKQKKRQADELKERKTLYSAINEMRPGRQKEEVELSAKHTMEHTKRKHEEENMLDRARWRGLAFPKRFLFLRNPRPTDRFLHAQPPA